MPKIIFAGGGTAGHVMPNLALIAELRRKYDCIYVGGDGMEKELCKSRGIPFYHIDTVKLRRDSMLKNLSVPFKLNACVSSAKKVVDEVKPDLIFSKGGYAALPVVLAAKKIPLLCHESDLTAGIVTKIAARKAVKTLCAFESTAERFKRGVYVGAPIRAEVRNTDRSDGARHAAKRRLGFDGIKPVLLIFGGSSGAAAINECAIGALPELLKTFDVVHITGKNKTGGEKRRGYLSMEFCDDMPALYSAADVAVTRGGANALCELIALRIPALCIPLEKASRGDQIENAEYFKSRGALAVLKESLMSPDILTLRTVEAYNRRSSTVVSQARLSVDGTDRICGIIEETIGK